MKQKLLFALGLLASMLVSCEESTTVDPVGDGNEVSFNVGGDFQFTAGDMVSVAALDMYMELSQSAQYSYSGTSFTSNNPIEKETASEELNYYAVYPFMSSYSNEFTYTIQSDQSAGYSSNSLLVGTAFFSTSLTPTLNFEQKLAGVMFAVKLSDGTLVEPSSVTLSAKLSVECDIYEADYTASGTAKSITPYAFTENGYMALVAPQSIASGSTFAEIEYAGATYTVSFDSEAALSSGTQYEYRFVLDESAGTASVEFVDSFTGTWADELSDENDPNPEPEPDPQDFSISLVETLGTDITINVDKGSYEGNYYVGAVDNADWASTSDEDLAAALMNYEIYTCGTDLSIVDNKWVYFDGGEVSVANGWDVEVNTDYRVIVFGVDGSGDIMTDLAVLLVNSGELVVTVEGYIDVQINKVEYDNITVTTTPSSEVKNYIYGMMLTSTYKSTYASSPEAAADYILDLYLGRSIDIATNNGVTVMRGVQTFGFDNAWVISQETDYTIFIFGVHETGVVNSEVYAEQVITPAPEPTPDPTDDFAISLVSTTPTDIIIDVDMGSWPALYYVGIWSGWDGTADELAEYLMEYEQSNNATDFGEANGLYIFDKGGEISLNGGWVIVPSKEYLVVAFGISEWGEIYTNVASLTAVTADMEYSGSIDVDLYEVTASTAKVRATPTAEVGNYVHILQKSSALYDTFEGDITALAYAGVAVLDAVSKDYGGAPDGEVVFNGAADFDMAAFWGVKASTSYVYAIFGVDADGLVTSEISFGEFTSPSSAAAYTSNYYDISKYGVAAKRNTLEAPRSMSVKRSSVEPVLRSELAGVVVSSKPSFR